jgi:lipid A ethanolaminephosphotransferase
MLDTSESVETIDARGSLPRLHCPSQAAFAVGVSTVWLVLYNQRFWQEAFNAMWRPELSSGIFLTSLFVLVLFLQALVLLLLPGRVLPRAAASALFVVAALSAHFSDSYGVLVDRDMVRNVFETDRSEVAGLLNAQLVVYFVLMGLLPALLVWRVDLPRVDWRKQLRERATFIAAGLVLCSIGIAASSASYAMFLREHKPIRFLISPGSMVTGATKYLAEAARARPDLLTDPGGKVTHVEVPNRRPKVLFLVVGETARAANFQLDGYARATNPRLSATKDVVYFENTTSCGTSTAISVPCMFSHLGREHYDKRVAAGNFNLLDMLSRAGIDVEWRDNNSGCKGVCARVTSKKLPRTTPFPLCRDGECVDEIMLSGLRERLSKVGRDTVIVFHQIGSHGPAYSARYPMQFQRFEPVCHSNELDRCSQQEVVNAYDNSILYTDHNLAEQIELLKSVSDRLDTLLIYVSDHGESLGEGRVYLHGMPYAFAPAVQKEVPFLMWTSESYRHRTGLRQSCLQDRAKHPASHDNLFHTVMGAMAVRNAVYRGPLDILAECQETWVTRR